MRTCLCLVSLAACTTGVDSATSDFRVLAVSPTNDATSVALDSPITLELSAPPAADFAVALTAGTGEPIPHALAIDGTTVTLTPSDRMWIATDYTIGVDAAMHAETGEVLGAPFASKFVTRDGAWHNIALQSQVALVMAAPLGAGAAPNLAALPDGTVFAGWEGGSALYDQKFTPATGWLPMPGALTISGGDPDAVDIAAAGPARAVAGHEKYVTRSSIEARTYNGSQWSAPTTVAPYNVGGTYYDQWLGGVAATDQTYALVFHRGSFSTDHFDLYASVHANNAWGAPIAVEQLVGTTSGSDIIADGKGGYVIAWSQRATDGTTAVWATTLSSSGVVGSPQKLDDGAGTVYSLSLARGGDTVWIAWMHQQGSIGMRVVAQPLGGSAHTIELDGYSFGGEWVQIAANARGALLVYTQYGGVFAALADGATWGSVVTVDATQPSGDAGRPAIALDDRGNATATWTRVPMNGRRTTMVARALRGQWSAAAQLDEGTGSTYVWTAGVDTAGRVTTAWTQSDTSGYKVWVAQLE